MEQAVQPYEGQPMIDFNPNDHLIQIPNKGGKVAYLPVQWRLVWFRLLCPQGTIDTEELEADNDRECEAEVYVWNQDTKRSEKVLKRAPGYARYRAVVTDGKGGRASATKTERGVDFPDFVEKAETGAVGRALAMLGYGTQFAMIEFDEGERIVDAPVERPAKPYQERRTFVEAGKPKDQALHDLATPGSYEQHQANGQAAQPAKNEHAEKIGALLSEAFGNDSKRRFQALREALNIPSGPLPAREEYKADDVLRIELYVAQQKATKGAA